jgi:tetratricopeptide (TPR) repeat protein
MSRVRRLIVETHQRSLWQALVVYAGASLGVLGTVDMFIDNLGLPRGLFWLAFSLLVMGLPVVIVISLAKEEVYGDDVPAEHGEAAAEEDRRLRFLTWRTAGFAFVGVLAVWGLVAAGWVVLGGTGYLLFRGAAAGFVGPEDCVVVAEFENETERPAAGLAVREAVVTDIGQTSYVTVLGYNQVRGTLGLMRLPDTIRVGQRLALEIAGRDNCPVVVSGTVAPLGTGYILSTRILEASTGEEVVPLSETAVDETEVVPAAQRLARLVRRHLGESLPSIGRSEPLARFTTSSLEALELYTLATRRKNLTDDEAEAIPLLEEAVLRDTAFAEAYRLLGSYYGNEGNPAAKNRNADLAYRFRDRLTFMERYRVLAQYHAFRSRLDSACYYYGVLAERYPNNAQATYMYGIYLDLTGRFEEAVESYRTAWEIDPSYFTAYSALPWAARPLGWHALADSALAIASEVTGQPFLNQQAWNAYYRGDLALVDSLAREMMNGSDPRVIHDGLRLRAGLAAMYGRMNEALALAQRAGVNPSSLLFIELASLAAGAPERALPYVDSLRLQSPFLFSARDEHERLGAVAYGYALAGDLQSTREVLVVMDSVLENNDFNPRWGIGQRVLAVVALEEGRAEEALEHSRRARVQSFGYVPWDSRLLLADGHAALGHIDEAIAQHDTLTGTYRLTSWRYHKYTSFPLRPLAHERLGSLYLQVGDTVAAARHLAEFIELWQDADPELQPRVESARRLLAQLAAEGT